MKHPKSKQSNHIKSIVITGILLPIVFVAVYCLIDNENCSDIKRCQKLLFTQFYSSDNIVCAFDSNGNLKYLRSSNNEGLKGNHEINFYLNRKKKNLIYYKSDKQGVFYKQWYENGGLKYFYKPCINSHIYFRKDGTIEQIGFNRRVYIEFYENNDIKEIKILSKERKLRRKIEWYNNKQLKFVSDFIDFDSYPINAGAIKIWNLDGSLKLSGNTGEINEDALYGIYKYEEMELIINKNFKFYDDKGKMIKYEPNRFLCLKDQR